MTTMEPDPKGTLWSNYPDDYLAGKQKEKKQSKPILYQGV